MEFKINCDWKGRYDMKRVLCMTSGIDAGGAESFMMKLLRNMDKTQYMIDFCVGNEKEGFYEKEAISLGSTIHHITLKSKNAKLFTKELILVLKENNYDAVLRLGDTYIATYDLWIAKAIGVQRRAMRSCNAASSGGRINQILHKLLRIPLTSAANIKIAPSTEAAEYTFGPGVVRRGKATILHNAVDMSVFRYREDERERIRCEFGLNDMTVYCHIGRFCEQKNHRFLIDVFSEIAKIDKSARFLLVGKGELEKHIREKIEKLGLSDKTIFAGVRTDIPELLSASDVFLLPSFYEGLPNTVVEAQTTGLPCIVSDTVTREANITGLVKYLPLGDASAWADECVEVSKCKRITDTKDAFISHQYDIETITREFEWLIFESVI